MILDDLELEINLCSVFRRQYVANSLRTAIARLPLRQLGFFVFLLRF